MIFTARVAKEAKKTLEIFSFIKVCFYYTVFKHSSTEKRFILLLRALHAERADWIMINTDRN